MLYTYNMITKYCKQCGITKNISEFHKNKSMKDGYSFYCKNCFYILYHEKTNNRNKKWYKNNRQIILAKVRIYTKRVSKKKQLYDKKYRIKNKDKINKYIKNKRKNNINFRLAGNLRIRTINVLKGINKSKRTLELLGCTVEYLRKHLESKFKEGMTWDNYGYYGWHIDHIKPCAKFDLSKAEEQKQCFHYTNLQPMWAKENIKKSDNFNAK
jgi:hypothetical protein